MNDEIKTKREELLKKLVAGDAIEFVVETSGMKFAMVVLSETEKIICYKGITSIADLANAMTVQTRKALLGIKEIDGILIEDLIEGYKNLHGLDEKLEKRMEFGSKFPDDVILSLRNGYTKKEAESRKIGVDDVEVF